MSDKTKAALDAAITAHVADEIGGGVVIAYIMQAAAVKPDDSENVTHYLRATADQPIHVTLGLASYMHHRTHEATNDDEDGTDA